MISLTKIGIFIVFLIVYTFTQLVLVAFAAKLAQYLLKDVNRLYQIGNLASISGIFVFLLYVYILSGFFDIILVILMLSVTLVSIIIVTVIRKFFISDMIPWKDQSIVSQIESNLKGNKLNTFVSVVALICLILYPIIAGIFYFKYPFPSERLTLIIFQLTLLLTLISATVLIPYSLLRSKNICEDARDAFFVAQVGSFLTIGLYLSLLFWSIGIDGGFYQLPTTKINLPVHSSLLISIGLYYMVGVLYPYISGYVVAKRFRIHLLQKQNEWFDKLLDILDLPTPSAYVSDLKTIKSVMELEKKQFIEDEDIAVLDEAYNMLHLLSQNDNSSIEKNITQVIQNSQKLDPRIRYLGFLDKRLAEINDCINQLEQLTTKDELIDISKDYATAYLKRKEEVTKKIHSINENKTAIKKYIGSAFLLISSGILVELGKLIVESLNI